MKLNERGILKYGIMIKGDPDTLMFRQQPLPDVDGVSYQIDYYLIPFPSLKAVAFSYYEAAGQRRKQKTIGVVHLKSGASSTDTFNPELVDRVVVDVSPKEKGLVKRLLDCAAETFEYPDNFLRDPQDNWDGWAAGHKQSMFYLAIINQIKNAIDANLS